MLFDVTLQEGDRVRIAKPIPFSKSFETLYGTFVRFTDCWVDEGEGTTWEGNGATVRANDREFTVPAMFVRRSDVVTEIGDLDEQPRTD